MQEELDKQNPVIDEVDDQLNKVTSQLKTNNAKLKGLVTQVGAAWDRVDVAAASFSEPRVHQVWQLHLFVCQTTSELLNACMFGSWKEAAGLQTAIYARGHKGMPYGISLNRLPAFSHKFSLHLH